MDCRVSTCCHLPLSGRKTIKEKTSIIIVGAGGGEEYLHFVILPEKLSVSCYQNRVLHLM